MRFHVFVLALVGSACVTTRAPEVLPCRDGDAARCLSFVALVEGTRERS